MKKPDKSSVDEKWSAIKAYRQANGLCFLCAEKWEGKHHKCPPQVSINMIHELMKLYNLEDGSGLDSSSDEAKSAEGVVMAVTHSSPNYPTKKRRTMRFTGFIGKQELLILLDSGGVGTFISDRVVQHIQQPVADCEAIHFTAADGGSMLSHKVLPNLQWFMQGHTFTYDGRILPLQGYDMILGADWLEDHSPMWIHWHKKKSGCPTKANVFSYLEFRMSCLIAPNSVHIN